MKIIQLVLAALFATAISAKLAAPKVGLKVNYFSNRNETQLRSQDLIDEIVEEIVEDNGASCSHIGDCGRAYQTCCAAFALKG